MKSIADSRKSIGGECSVHGSINSGFLCLLKAPTLKLSAGGALRTLAVASEERNSPDQAQCPASRRTSRNGFMNKRLIAALGFFLTGLVVASPTITLTHVRGGVYVYQEDYPLSDENGAVYVGTDFVTVVGATFTSESARLLTREIAQVTRKRVREVIDTNDNLDRAGGNAYFKRIGARIVSTNLTRTLLKRDWDKMVSGAHERYPEYPIEPVTLPDTTFPGDFTLQDGRVRAIYLGPSHAPDDIFVYFPKEQVLYGGCILKEQLGNLAFADLVEYPKTLEKLKKLNLGYTTIIAGHWSPIHGPELVDQYLALLLSREAAPTGGAAQ